MFGLRRLFRNISEIEKLSQLGVLFLLFEMGLELSLDRLKVTLNEFSRPLAPSCCSGVCSCHLRCNMNLHPLYSH